MFTAVRWEALAEEGDTTEREHRCTLELVFFQAKPRGMGMQHNHTVTEDKNLELPFKISLI